jgi:transcriptional regulator of acetoin/glycerol metabolism
LLGALKAARGNVSAAARLLGRPRSQVMRWLRDLNIDPLAYR